VETWNTTNGNESTIRTNATSKIAREVRFGMFGSGLLETDETYPVETGYSAVPRLHPLGEKAGRVHACPQILVAHSPPDRS